MGKWNGIGEVGLEKEEQSGKMGWEGRSGIEVGRKKWENGMGKEKWDGRKKKKWENGMGREKWDWSRKKKVGRSV
jgi:hypothetical protein